MNNLRLHTTLLEQSIQNKDLQLSKLQEIIDSVEAKLKAEVEKFENIEKLKKAKEAELELAKSQITSMQEKGLTMVNSKNYVFFNLTNISIDERNYGKCCQD